jgi:hypothetical protein
MCEAQVGKGVQCGHWPRTRMCGVCGGTQPSDPGLPNIDTLPVPERTGDPASLAQLHPQVCASMTTSITSLPRVKNRPGPDGTGRRARARVGATRLGAIVERRFSGLVHLLDQIVRPPALGIGVGDRHHDPQSR